MERLDIFATDVRYIYFNLETKTGKSQMDNKEDRGSSHCLEHFLKVAIWIYKSPNDIQQVLSP